MRIIKGYDEGIKYLSSLRRESGNVEKDVENTVKEIISEIREKGDKALLHYTKKFDYKDTKDVTIEDIKVSKEEIEEAYNSCDKELIEALELAKVNIEGYHKNQIKQGFSYTPVEGKVMGQMVRGLERVGVYVPGGTAAYPSTVLMNVIPAKLASVEKVVMITPGSNSQLPAILAAAKIAGVDEVYKISGAQGIAALAHGTETIKRVDKIVGPGNIFVATAKKLCYGAVDIDSIAGPSEILVVADDSADKTFVAADLLSQSEHDVLAAAILVTDSERLINEISEEVEKQLSKLSRKEIAGKSLENYGAAILVKDLKEAINLANAIAPEHLELMVENPFEHLGAVKNAGSIFLGKYSPEPLGDYMGGPNHVLPTSGTARFFSPLSVDDFIKKTSYIYYSREELEKIKDKIVKIADTEGLTAHGNSIKVRFK